MLDALSRIALIVIVASVFERPLAVYGGPQQSRNAARRYEMAFDRMTALTDADWEVIHEYSRNPAAPLIRTLLESPAALIVAAPLKPLPMTVTVWLGTTTSGVKVRTVRSTSWVAVVVTTIGTALGSKKVNSARTELVEGMAASRGTVKLPLMLPEASGVKVATVQANDACQSLLNATGNYRELRPAAETH